MKSFVSSSVLPITLLTVAAGLSVATSVPPPRHRVPTHSFIDYCGAPAGRAEALVTNDTNRPVQARFLGEAGMTREVAPGSAVVVTLAPGRYAFELANGDKVRDRRWIKVVAGRRYVYFHR